MILKRFSVKDGNTNCYVAACPNTKQAMIIDLRLYLLDIFI